jgi:S1-C subfamily serine protease
MQLSATIKADNRPVSMVLYVTTAARVQESFGRSRAQGEGGKKETAAMIRRVPWMTCLCVLALMSLPGCRGRMASVQAQTNPESAATRQGHTRHGCGRGSWRLWRARWDRFTCRSIPPSSISAPCNDKPSSSLWYRRCQAIPFPRDPKNLSGRGSGSGFVWDTLGHIVTNNHVVEGATALP